jgi:hypothetical protein
MSFGKRGTGEGHPARNLLPAQPVLDDAAPVAARTKVANPGAIDKSFIALALGVVVVSGGAAFAVPSVMDMFGGIPVRPIAIVVAGLDRDQAKTALAREAFPDNEGHAFMTSLQSKFPKDHDTLLGALADRALKGGTRDALVVELNEWSAEFAPKNFAAISRTGNEGFDEGMRIVQDGLNLLEKTAGGCTANTLMTAFYDPSTLTSLTAYGSEGYKVNVRATHSLVDLADKGRNKSPVDTDLTPDDMSALQTTFFSFMMDPQVMGLLARAGQGGGPVGFGADAVDPNDIDLCQLGRTVIVKLKKLPHPTKARLMGMLANVPDLSQFVDVGGMGGSPFSSFGSMSGGSMSGGPMFGPPQGLPPEMMQRLNEAR